MKRIRKLTFAALVVSLLVAGCASHSGSEATPLPSESAAPGTITGIYVQENRDHSGREAVEGVTVGVYTKEFLPGPNQFHPPKPIRKVTTGTGGAFSISGLASGRYFLATIGAPFVGTASAVVTGDHGAAVLLIGCRDCPAPA